MKVGDTYDIANKADGVVIARGTFVMTQNDIFNEPVKYVFEVESAAGAVTRKSYLIRDHTFTFVAAAAARRGRRSTRRGRRSTRRGRRSTRRN